MKIARPVLATLIFFLFSSVGYADTVTFMDQDLTYDQSYTQDVDGDGFEELTFYMQGDALVLSVWDTDQNGQPDRWFSYGEDDALAVEGVSTDETGEPNEFFSIDAEGNATPVKPKLSFPVTPVLIAGGFALLMAAFFSAIKRKGGTSAAALLLAAAMAFSTISPSFADSVLDDDCSINDAVFERDWMKYSDVDARIELTARSYEAQQIQSIADDLKFHYSALFLIERDMEIERMKRLELKNIKNLLVRNIKNNLLKSFIRLTYVTYDTVQGAYGNKGSVKAILDRSTAGAQVITSYIKIRKSLSIPSKTEAQTKGLYDRSEGIVNSTVLEYFDTAGDPKKVAVNLVNDLQKEAFDIVKTEDNWSDANLTDEDFKILKDQYNKNRDFDVAIQESYLLSSQLRDEKKGHEEAIRFFESEYLSMIAEEKARVRDMLVSSCMKSKNEETPEDQDEPLQPADNQPSLPDSGYPSSLQLDGEYAIDTKATVYFENQTQSSSAITSGKIESIGERKIRFIGFSNDDNLDASYNPENGSFETTQSIEGFTYTLKGKAFIQNGTVMITMTIDGSGHGGRFHFDSEGRKKTGPDAITGAPSKNDLLGSYQMSMHITTVNNGKEQTYSDSVESTVSIVNGQIAFTDSSSEYAGSVLDYDESSGVLSYYYNDENMTLTVQGSAVYVDGVIQIDIVSEQTEEDYYFKGVYTLRKIQ